MDNLILTPNIARELLATYRQFTEFNKDKVDDLSLAEFQKLLAVYGQLYFDTTDTRVVLERLGQLASLNEQALPTAGVPNADQLKTLVENHERYLREKALHDSSWRKRQASFVKEKLASVKTQAVVYQREPVLATEASSPPLIPIRPDLPDRIADFAELEKIEDIEAIVREAGVLPEIAGKTAEKIRQYIKLTTSEGLALSPQILQERVETFLSRLGATVTPAQVEQITERLGPSLSGKPGVAPSPYIKTPRPRAQVHRDEEVVQQPEGQDRTARRRQQYLYLVYRGQPYWRTFTDQLSPLSWFGKQKDPAQSNLQLIRAELERIQHENPKIYQEYSTIFQAIGNRVDQLIKAGIALENVEIVTPQNLEQTIQNLDEITDVVQRLEFNEQTQSLRNSRETKESLISSLPVQARLALEEKRFAAQQVARLAGQETRRVRENLLSALSVKLRQLFTNPNIGWLRWSLSGALAASTAFLPAPLAVAAAGGSASLALAQLKHAGGVLKNAGLLAAKLAGVSLGPIGAAVIAALSFAEPLLKALKWIFIGLFTGLAILVFIAVAFVFHGIFVKEVPTSATAESKYIATVKTAAPASIQNSNLPAQITYSISITARDKALKNIRVNDQFSATGKNSPPSPAAQIPAAPTSLAPEANHTLSYTINLDSRYEDSLITNTITVIADVEEGPSGETTTKTATVIVGSPPANCPVSWPTSGYVNQGPNTVIEASTHQNTEAIDIHNRIGTQVVATVDGIASAFTDQYGGLDVKITTRCNGRDVTIKFVHLSRQLVPATGKFVKRGEVIGLMGETGWAGAGSHLHYQFDSLPMIPPYIPQTVPQACVGPVACGSIRF